MKTNVDYQWFQLQCMEKLYPGFWTYVQVKFLKKENITYEQLKEFNNYVDLLSVESTNDIQLLKPSHQELARNLYKIYVKGYEHYQNDQLRYQQQQQLQYQQQIYAQQQYGQYGQQQYGQYGQQQYGQYGQQQYGQYGQQQYGQYGQQQYGQYGQPYPNQQANYDNLGQQNQAYQQNQYQNNHHGNNRHYNQHNNRHSDHHNTKYMSKRQDQNSTPADNAQASLNYKQTLQKVSELSTKNSEPETPKNPVKQEPPKLQKKKLSIDQIRKMIANIADKQELKKTVTPKLIQQIQEVNKWVKKVQTIQIVAQKKQDGNYNKKGGKDHPKSNQTNKDNYDINKGTRYQRPPIQSQPTFDIQIGKNQNLQTKLIKNQFKKKAAQGDFADRKEEEQKRLGKIPGIKRQILFNLNRIAPQNLKDIFKQIQNFALQQYDICSALVDSIIQKAWEQPKYAASYAKLSSYFGKIDISKFKFTIPQKQKEKKKKNNPFKYILIERVQHSFDKKQKKQVPKNQDDFEKYARDTKNLIMGNVKFIAEMIKIKLIHKNIIRYCISNLLMSFLEGRYRYAKHNDTQNNYFEYYFEAIIQFIENLGQKFEYIDEKQEKQEQKQSKVKQAIQKVKQYCQLKQQYKQIQELLTLKTVQFFDVFKMVNSSALKQVKDGKRLSALLQNLQERRINGWKKHNVQSEGPKKLKDLNKQQQTPEQKAKADLQFLDKSIQKILKKWVENDHKQALDILQSISKKYNIGDLICSYLKYVADDKLASLPKRIELFSSLMKYFNEKQFNETWKKSIGNIALLASQFPYCQAVLAKILILYSQNKSIKYDRYFIKFNEEEQQDEYYFMDQIFQKLYHYTSDQSLKNIIQPKKKLTHLL